jgi:hypothetical protein
MLAWKFTGSKACARTLAKLGREAANPNGRGPRNRAESAQKALAAELPGSCIPRRATPPICADASEMSRGKDFWNGAKGHQRNLFTAKMLTLLDVGISIVLLFA